jgi:hypothetical protein
VVTPILDFAFDEPAQPGKLARPAVAEERARKSRRLIMSKSFSCGATSIG